MTIEDELLAKPAELLAAAKRLAAASELLAAASEELAAALKAAALCAVCGERQGESIYGGKCQVCHEAQRAEREEWS